MRGFMVYVAIAALAATGAGAQDMADSATAWPTKNAPAQALDPSVVADYITSVQSIHILSDYQGMNQALQKQAAPTNKKSPVAAGISVDLRGPELFTASIDEGDATVYLAAVQSIDAYALRVLLDLSALGSNDELFVLDPTSLIAHGPFTQADTANGEFWSPSVEGDILVIALRSSSADTPDAGLIGVSHFYMSFDQMLKALGCNNNIACEANTNIQNASTAVGLMFIPTADGGQSQCSGCLVNNPDTAAFESYFLTANHCVGSVSEAQGIEVVWDFRSSSCNSDAAPSVGSLPRSMSQGLLATNAGVDGTLLLLGNVPVGNGRTYLGWNTNLPALNTNILAIHHPDGSHMRISYGHVITLGATAFCYKNQIEVKWDDGVTEGGSSGSALLLAATLQVIGMLSNGPTHSCTDTSGNTDKFGSFSAFFPNISGWLSGTNPPLGGVVIPDDCTTPGPGGCPFKVSLEDYPQTLANLRTFRDETLMRTAWGRKAVDIYYAAAPSLAQWVSERPERMGAFRLAATPVAHWTEILHGAAAR